MGFFQDFVSGVRGAAAGDTNADVSRKTASPASQKDTIGQSLGEVFFSFGQEYLKSGRGKQAVADTLRKSSAFRAAEEQAARERRDAFLRDPKMWAIAAVVLFTVFAFGAQLGRGR